MQNSKQGDRPITQFRFLDRKHREMVKSAARRAGLSMNAWIVKTTLDQARKEIAAR
jgi:predicted HicB family RNase H-like nuclease